jgi:hypothetical protein
MMHVRPGSASSSMWYHAETGYISLAVLSVPLTVCLSICVEYVVTAEAARVFVVLLAQVQRELIAYPGFEGAFAFTHPC